MFGDIGGITDTIARGIANLLAILERIAVAVESCAGSLESIAHRLRRIDNYDDTGRPIGKGW